MEYLVYDTEFRYERWGDIHSLAYIVLLTLLWSYLRWEECGRIGCWSWMMGGGGGREGAAPWRSVSSSLLFSLINNFAEQAGASTNSCTILYRFDSFASTSYNQVGLEHLFWFTWHKFGRLFFETFRVASPCTWDLQISHCPSPNSLLNKRKSYFSRWLRIQ
jgi:hypothetical protein